MTSMTDRKCACCGGAFLARTADVARGWAKFCSKSCKAKKQEARTHQNRDFQRRKDVSQVCYGYFSDLKLSDVDGEGGGWDAHKDY